VAGAALTPELALGLLSELSTDVRVATVLAPDGSTAATDPHDRELGEALRAEVVAMLSAADRAGDETVGELEVTVPEGAVFVSRLGGWTLAVVTGRWVLSSLMRYDLRRVLADLEGVEA
jgi:predicted regulator of Ras-like GTPase activity (Roadblock/LC7/MglB family)